LTNNTLHRGLIAGIFAATIFALATCGTQPSPAPLADTAATSSPALPATTATTPGPTAAATPTPGSAPAGTPSPATTTPAGFVARKGAGLVLNGKPFRFTGYDVYNATSDNECGGTMGVGSELNEALSTWSGSQTVMRTWFFQSLATTGGARDWSTFDHTLAVARQHHIRIIATLGNHRGDCEDGRIRTAGWYNSGYRTDHTGGRVAYRDWVAEVTQHYRDDPTILAWQLMNEAEANTSPDGGCSDNGGSILRRFADDVGGVVRQHDPHHLISLGTMGGGQCGTDGADYSLIHASPQIDLCEFHDYNVMDALPGSLADDLGRCHALGKPLFIGEVGITMDQAGGSLNRRSQLFQCKLQAAISHGAVGALAWNWAWESAEYAIGPKDPTARIWQLTTAFNAPRSDR
jgi:hypothetical protein